MIAKRRKTKSYTIKSDIDKTESKDTVDVPTGDISATGVFADLLIIAGGAIITLLKRKKRV